jgi:hypothetical protein
MDNLTRSDPGPVQVSDDGSIIIVLTDPDAPPNAPPKSFEDAPADLYEVDLNVDDDVDELYATADRFRRRRQPHPPPPPPPPLPRARRNVGRGCWAVSPDLAQWRTRSLGELGDGDEVSFTATARHRGWWLLVSG